MALLRKEFTRAQLRSRTRRVCECQLFFNSVLCDGISCLDQRSSFTFTVILSWKVTFYRIHGLVNNINISNMVAVSLLQVKKMTLGQVVPNFTEQVLSSKILRIFRWKLWVILCTVPLSKWPQDTKKHVEISWRFQAVLLCLD